MTAPRKRRLKVLSTEIVRIIPNEDAEEYRRQGWLIRDLDGHHGAHSALAVMRMPKPTRKTI